MCVGGRVLGVVCVGGGGLVLNASNTIASATVDPTKSLFAFCSALEIMALFMLYVVDKYAWDFYMGNANF